MNGRPPGKRRGGRPFVHIFPHGMSLADAESAAHSAPETALSCS
jgi:hypothetical protein